MECKEYCMVYYALLAERCHDMNLFKTVPVHLVPVLRLGEKNANHKTHLLADGDDPDVQLSHCCQIRKNET